MQLRKRFASLRTRMILLFVPVTVITLTVTGLFCYYRTRKVIRQHQLDIAGNLLEQEAAKVGDTLDRAIQVTEQILYFTPVRQTLLGGEQNEQPEMQMEDYRATSTFLHVLEQQFGYMRVRIFAHGIGGMLPPDNIRLFRYGSLERELPVSDMIQDRTQQIHLAETYRYPANSDAEKGNWILSVVRFLVNGPDNYVEAVISLDLDSTELLAEWVMEDDGLQPLYLINRQGRVLSSGDASKINTETGGELALALYDHRLWREGNSTYLSQRVAHSDWLLFMELPDSYGWREAQSILTTILGMIALACIGGTLAVLVISRALTNRIQALAQMIESSTIHSTLPDVLSLHIREEPGEHGEIAVLIQAYNHMLERIGALSAENAHMAVRESRYRMEALRLQINSHFLYNALASIKGYIEMNDAPTASALLMELAAFFKRSLDKGNVCITLREELEIVNAYLNIQQLVYEGIFDYRIDVPGPLSDTRIPKFLLQPIVENAVVHGVTERREGGKILISAFARDDRVYICVEDNGPGFSKEMLAVREAGEAPKRGIGTDNVERRLKLYFGLRARLQFENLPGGGGRVVIEMPHGGIPQEEADAYDQDSFGR